MTNHKVEIITLDGPDTETKETFYVNSASITSGSFKQPFKGIYTDAGFIVWHRNLKLNCFWLRRGNPYQYIEY